MLGWFAYLWFNPKPAPYHYQLVAEGGVDQFDTLGLGDWPDLTLRKYEVRVAEVDTPIAVAHLASRGNAAPVLLSWESRTSEPVVALDSKLSELTALAGAIARYAPKDALILSWWDTSRQIRLLAARDTLFNAHLGEPLMSSASMKTNSGVPRRRPKSARNSSALPTHWLPTLMPGRRSCANWLARAKPTWWCMSPTSTNWG